MVAGLYCSLLKKGQKAQPHFNGRDDEGCTATWAILVLGIVAVQLPTSEVHSSKLLYGSMDSRSCYEVLLLPLHIHIYLHVCIYSVCLPCIERIL